MKPVPLMAYPIMNSSMTGCTVLDPFGGSGSTLIACEQTERTCYMIELDEKFCDVVVKRYIEQVGAASEVRLERNGRCTHLPRSAAKNKTSEHHRKCLLFTPFRVMYVHTESKGGTCK